MPGPPIRKPSDHSPPAGSPRNIAGHHVLHRPLMPRHPPNAQKNKQQRHTNKTRNTLSQKSYSKMLASTIQFTTNPPTPTHNPQQQIRSPDGSGNQGALPQNPDSMPPPHAPSTQRGHPPPPNTGSRGCVSYTNTDKPATPARTHPTRHDQLSIFPQGQAPGRPRPIQRPEQDQQPGSHPHTQLP